MEEQIIEFEKSIISKYNDDINNIYLIQDYIVLESNNDCELLIKDIFNNDGEKLVSQKNGKFSILINNKFLLIAKKGELSNIFKIIYKFLLALKNNYNNELAKQFISNNIKKILLLINLVLIFNDNITFYSLKKKIFLFSVNKNSINENDLLSEYYFTHITNKKNRKSAISWDYKNFLIYYFKNKIFTEENKIQNPPILNLLLEEITVISLNKEIFLNKELLFIIKDLSFINDINLLNSRNCHMWAYLRKIYNEGSDNEKILILLYAFNILKKCSFDYSAFSFIVNSRKNLPLDKAKIKLLIENAKKSKVIKYEEHIINYINNI